MSAMDLLIGVLTALLGLAIVVGGVIVTLLGLALARRAPRGWRTGRPQR